MCSMAATQQNRKFSILISFGVIDSKICSIILHFYNFWKNILCSHRYNPPVLFILEIKGCPLCLKSKIDLITVRFYPKHFFDHFTHVHLYVKNNKRAYIKAIPLNNIGIWASNFLFNFFHNYSKVGREI